LYVCRLCNTARSNRPVIDAEGRRLLNITVDTWADHFFLDGFRLHPVAGDLNAEYTAEAYDINEPRRLAIPQNRATPIAEAADFLDRARSKIAPLIEAASRDLLSTDTAVIARGQETIELARDLEKGLSGAQRILERWKPVPADNNTVCRCGTNVNQSLP